MIKPGSYAFYRHRETGEMYYNTIVQVIEYRNRHLYLIHEINTPLRCKTEWGLSDNNEFWELVIEDNPFTNLERIIYEIE